MARLVKEYYVYHLSELDSEEIVYIGSSKDVEKRKRRAELRYGCRLRLTCVKGPFTVSDARMKEKEDVLRFKPVFNKHLMFGIGSVGVHHTNEAKKKLSVHTKRLWREGRVHVNTAEQKEGASKRMRELNKTSKRDEFGSNLPVKKVLK